MERLPDPLQRFVEIGALPSDSDELRARKAGLVLSSALMAALSCVWVVTYAVLGLWVSVSQAGFHGDRDHPFPTYPLQPGTGSLDPGPVP